MSEEINKAIIRDLDALVSRGVAVPEEAFHPDWVGHGGTWPYRESTRSRALPKITEFWSQFENVETSIEAQLAVQDLVFTRRRATATYKESGKQVSWEDWFLDRLRDEKVIESWALFDIAGRNKQLQE